MSKTRLSLRNVVGLTRSLRRRRARSFVILTSLMMVYMLLIMPFSLRRWHCAEVAAYDTSIANLPPPRVFIAAMLANCAPLLSQHWIPALLKLVDKLGAENVFVSILENGSVDESRELLAGLEKNLTKRGVQCAFRYEENFRDGVAFQSDGLLNRILGKEGTGDNWIKTDEGWFPRRISYLAELRNMVLEPMIHSTRQFDKILFINDVIFSAEGAIRLLHTNQGNHAAACGLDYFSPHLFYDTFAMRDYDGNPTIAKIYPFFPRGQTRTQLLARSTKVPVKSCWNGMVSLNAAPFQNATNPLRFRAIPSSLSLQTGYLEGSEACLINADMQSHWSHLLKESRYPSTKAFVNPLVRVSYTKGASIAQFSLIELFMEKFVGPFVAVAYDIRDWWVQGRLARHKAERSEKIRDWERQTGGEEVGTYCLTDQLQLLTPWGWAHV